VKRGVIFEPNLNASGQREIGDDNAYKTVDEDMNSLPRV